MSTKIISFVKKETILCISLLLAVISAFFVHPDNEYMNYVDWHTLMLLFSLMAVMAGLQRLGVFRKIGIMLLSHTKNTRQLALILVFLPFFFSMLITNDVALITFVPFAIIVLKLADSENMLVPVVILQTVAANLGSMLTPMGNPQNLYLFSQSQMSLAAFLKLMLPYTVTAALCLLIVILFFKKKGIDMIDMENNSNISRLLFFMYLILFFLCLLCVLDIIDVKVVTAIIIIFLLVFERKIFTSIDYSLLGTFIGFFIFIGNMGRLPQFHNFIENLIIGNEAPVSILSSQVISNVPSALLLSGFTDNWNALIVGTNLGGLGTLIASMASLISYKQIARNYPGKRISYLIWFTITNIIMLCILFAIYLFLN
ncbi:MAG: anion permease [Lachnospiraceae bacterium]|nr:anion permease [Lachnospiraceae bacterium]